MNMKWSCYFIVGLIFIGFIAVIYTPSKIAIDNTAGFRKDSVQTKNASNAKVALNLKDTSNVKDASNAKVTRNLKDTSNVKADSNAKVTAKFKTKANNKAVPKYLIFLCDNRMLCGGLSDRERGIAYAYLTAIQYERKFGIILSAPCDFRQFYIPNQYNWIIPESELIGKPQKLINNIDSGFVDLSKETTEVIYLRTNSEFGMAHVYPRIVNKLPPQIRGGNSVADMFKLIWEFLMKPSHHIMNHLKTFNLSQNMTCAHVRIGKSKNLPNDSPRNNLADVPKLWDFLDTFDKDSVLFVATDNKEVRESAKKRFGQRYFDTAGKIVHIDRQTGMDGACIGFETAVIDQIILSKCSTLVISNSGFSARAAMLRNNPKELYRFSSSDGIKPFKLD